MIRLLTKNSWLGWNGGFFHLRATIILCLKFFILNYPKIPDSLSRCLLQFFAQTMNRRRKTRKQTRQNKRCGKQHIICSNLGRASPARNPMEQLTTLFLTIGSLKRESNVWPTDE